VQSLDGGPGYLVLSINCFYCIKNLLGGLEKQKYVETGEEYWSFGKSKALDIPKELQNQI
jgi:hypothetical protein